MSDKPRIEYILEWLDEDGKWKPWGFASENFDYIRHEKQLHQRDSRLKFRIIEAKTTYAIMEGF